MMNNTAFANFIGIFPGSQTPSKFVSPILSFRHRNRYCFAGTAFGDPDHFTSGLDYAFRRGTKLSAAEFMQ
jgi:hypothetical protein